MPGVSPEHRDSRTGAGGSVPKHPSAAEESTGRPQDVEEALGILKAAHERTLTSDEEQRLSEILTNLGVAREHLANMVKRLARGPDGEAPPVTDAD